MALKKQFNISYRTRLLIPVVGMMWFVVAVLVYVNYQREVRYREEMVNNRLRMVQNRVVGYYEDGDNLQERLEFIESYIKESLIDGVRLAVFNENDSLLCSIGDISELDFKELPIKAADNVVRLDDHSDDLYYYRMLTSVDGRCIVHIAMPYTSNIASAINTEMGFWIFVVTMVLFATLMAYYSTKYLTRNVRMLKNFALSLENDRGGSVVMPDFPHDELGEVSRRLVSMYREKDDAIARSEREHRIAINAMREQERIKRELTNNINHELKTPVGVVRGYLDTICETPDIDEATRNRFLERARQNVNRLCSLLDDVSTMTRLEDGASSLPLSAVNIHDIVYNIENELPVTGLAGDMKFVSDLPINCVVMGNENLLSAMICNLIKNAAIHSHGTEMGIKLIVESAKFYTFAFYDNGVGVKDVNLPRIFERFFREDSGRSRKVGGTGLGLPIVKNTIEALGGTVSAHNRSNGGLEFHFTLQKWEE